MADNDHPLLYLHDYTHHHGCTPSLAANVSRRGFFFTRLHTPPRRHPLPRCECELTLPRCKCELEWFFFLYTTARSPPPSLRMRVGGVFVLFLHNCTPSLTANASRRGFCSFPTQLHTLPRCKCEPEWFFFPLYTTARSPPPSLQTRAGGANTSSAMRMLQTL